MCTGLPLGRLVCPSAAVTRHAASAGASAAERGNLAPAGQPQPPPCWPRAIRAVRAGLAPRVALQHWWQAWSKAPPPRQLQALTTSLETGHDLHLYIRRIYAAESLLGGSEEHRARIADLLAL